MKHIYLHILSLFLLIFLFGLPYSHANISRVDMVFCNNGVEKKKLNLGEYDVGDKTEICVKITNLNDTTISLNTNFVDAVTTSDGSRIACKDENVPKTRFASYLDYKDVVLKIPANESVTKKIPITLPLSAVGKTHGCFTYYISSNQKSKGALKVVQRKANILEISGKGDLSAVLEITSPDNKKGILSDKKDKIQVLSPKGSGKVNAQIKLENKGNIPIDTKIITEFKQKNNEIASSNTANISILPGESKTYVSPNVDLEEGKYIASMSISYSSIDKNGKTISGGDTKTFTTEFLVTNTIKKSANNSPSTSSSDESSNYSGTNDKDNENFSISKNTVFTAIGVLVLFLVLCGICFWLGTRNKKGR